MANLGYIQVVRHCNHLCGFCSNPTARYEHTFETMRELVDDFAQRGYFGVIFTGGEPTLHPELPQITRYARARGLHARLITNGSRLADAEYAAELAEAGLELVNFRVDAVGRTPKPKLRHRPDEGPDASPALKGRRMAHFDSCGEMPDVPVYQGEQLRTGNRLTGPAIVEYRGTTAVVQAGQTAWVDGLLDLVIEVKPESA